MTFTCKDYVSENETTVLSGTVYRTITTKYAFEGFCNFLLTNKKIIQAGEDILSIVPLNKITRIRIDNYDGIKSLEIYSVSDSPIMRIVNANNADWFNQILREIAKRIG
jgi:hypothetical protein